MSDLTPYTEPIQGIVARIQKERFTKTFSDLADPENHPYIDLVMEGGGVLGIGLVGFTYALEQAGFRFRHIGGASAGAINALLLAVMRPDSDGIASKKVLERLATLDLFKFVDGNWGSRGLVKTYFRDQGIVRIAKILLCAVPVLYDLFTKLGLNRGDAFLQWLIETLAESRIATQIDLQARLKERGEAIQPRQDAGLPSGQAVSVQEVKLGLITTDVTTETKVEFPRMAPMYWQDAGQVNPAHFVRASMSIPFFFRPYRALNVSSIPEVAARWHELAGYDGAIPPTAIFTDGGITSNFPIDLFHVTDRVPLAPTFGVRLNPRKRTGIKVESIWNLLYGMFESSRHCLDYDFLMKHPDYRQLMAWVDTRGFNWLNFAMPVEQKIKLFQHGAEAALELVTQFDWEDYKEFRRLQLPRQPVP